MADFQELKKQKDDYFALHYRVLLHMLNLEIQGRNEPVLSFLNQDEFEKLAALSGRHKTDYYLFTYFQQFPHIVPSEQLQQLKNRMTRQAMRSLVQMNELKSLCKSLNQKGISYAVIKGPHLARMLYGNAAVKVSVDLDVLMVNPDDLACFHEVLTAIGYACVEQHLMNDTWKKRLYISAKRELHYFNRMAGCTVDLHVKPLVNTILTAHRYRDFFEDIELVAFEGIMLPVLPAEKDFVYLCYHAACHRFSRLAWLMDIRNFYVQKRDLLNEEKILSIARSLRIERTVCLAFIMLNILFNVDIPKKVKSTVGNSNLLKKLAIQCLRAISFERAEDLKFQARFDRLVFLIRLNRGFTGKADVLLSVLLRHLVLLFFRRKR
ncbi:MAG: nucleotidyltransferase family protein [Bacteroidales bacterium]|nr:nucleotidyltransferase family protein [Bacteroidales bacterium]